MTRFGVNRLNGEPLEIHLPKKEADQLKTTKDLKKILLTADQGAPAVCVVRLLHDVEIQDEEPINWDLLEQGSLQYIIEPKLSTWCRLDPPLVFQDPYAVLAKFKGNPEKLLDRCVVINLAHKVWADAECDDIVCSRFYDAWTATVLDIPMEKANHVESDGSTCLDRLMTLLVEVLLTRSDEICPEYYNGYELVSCLGDEFVIDLAHRAAGEMAIRFVKDKLQVETVEHTFKTPSDEARETLWMLIQRKEKRRGHSTVYSKGGLEGGLGAAFMLALMDKGLPRWCWGGHARHSMDNLLQYTLTFLKKLLLNPYMDHGKTEAERQLCLELAKRFSLEELCYQNKHGQNALYYAVKFVDASDQAFPLLKFLCDGDEAHAWMEVRDTIRQQMELRVREFQGSLMELVALTASVLDALEGECLPAFDDQLEQRATPIREQWLRMGWRFSSATFEDQIDEVVLWHFRTLQRA